jgi:type VI protein secretion system component Hcp
MSLGEYVSNAPIRSFSQNAWVPTDPESGRTTGTPELSDITISRDADTASPHIARFAANYANIPTAQVVLADLLLTINLEDVRVIQDVTKQMQNGVPVEELVLQFRRITWSYGSGDPATLTYDRAQREASGGAEMAPDYVTFGTNVPPTSRPGQIPFSNFTFGTTIPCTAGGGQCTGTARFVPPSVTSKVSGQTIGELTQLFRAQPLDVLTAQFAALASDGSVVDRMRYRMAPALVLSVLIDVGVAMGVDSSPTRVLQDTMGLNLRQITWTAQSLVGGEDVTETWDSVER